METQALTIPEMIAKKEALENQIRQAQGEARSGALAKIKELMATNGLTVADLAGKAATTPKAAVVGDARKAVAPKYKDPETGATWTGRGLKPKWLANALAAGREICEFAIKEPQAETEAA